MRAWGSVVGIAGGDGIEFILVLIGLDRNSVQLGISWNSIDAPMLNCLLCAYDSTKNTLSDDLFDGFVWQNLLLCGWGFQEDIENGFVGRLFELFIRPCFLQNWVLLRWGLMKARIRSWQEWLHDAHIGRGSNKYKIIIYLHDYQYWILERINHCCWLSNSISIIRTIKLER